jgi:hypothetical protein
MLPVDFIAAIGGCADENALLKMGKDIALHLRKTLRIRMTQPIRLAI